MKRTHTIIRKDAEAQRRSPRLTPAARDGWRLGAETAQRCEETATRRLALLMESVA